MTKLLPDLDQKGVAPLLLLISAVAVIAFLGLSSLAPFRDQLLSVLNRKPDSFASSGSDTSHTAKVLVLKYFPVDSSGQNLDSTIAGVGGSLTDIRNKVNDLTTQGITQMTNGTKFRGYKDTAAQPAITYQVLDSKEYLEALPVSTNRVPWNQSMFRPNYQQVLTREDICNFVDNQGVTQVWLWGYHFGNVEPVESNMAMGTSSQSFWNRGSYGDISNSEQTNDMPVCNKTYVLYNYNYGRGLGELLEDHGHQIEAVYRFVDNVLWDKFQKPNGDTNPSAINHCGWTHSPPNSGDWAGDRGQYDWNDKTIVKSDCEDWKPDGGGAVKDTNCNNWYEPYYRASYTTIPCQDDTGIAFKVWWMQNIPGRANNLTYQSKSLKNWWDFYADFDTALSIGKILTLPASSPSPSSIMQVIVKDSFNRADNSGSIGTAETGQTWVTQKGTWGIINGNAYPSNGCPAPGYATVDAGLTDGEYKVTLTANRQDLGLVFRYVDQQNFYVLNNDGGSYVVYKILNGVPSEVGRSTTPRNDGDVINIKLNGSQIEVLVNNNIIITGSDSGLNGTMYGFSNWCNSGIRFDDLSFSKSVTESPSPSATLTPSPSPVPSPSPSPSPSPTPEATTTVAFDDASGQSRALNGAYPAGVIDWGTNVWYLSAPWKKFTTKSFSFNGSGKNTGTFTLTSPRKLISLDAYNGGTGASTVTLKCAGNPDKVVSVAADQILNIQTGWTTSCSSVNISSSNGWNTNFDNIVLSGQVSNPTPTPSQTPLPSPSQTPVPVPSGTTQTISFNDKSTGGLNGQYPTGVINWGNNKWWVSAPWKQFTTRSISFLNSSINTASFDFVNPKVLVSLEAVNGGSGSATTSLSCSGNSTVNVTIPVGAVTKITTNWTTPCTTVTITSTNGWNTNYDNLVIQ